MAGDPHFSNVGLLLHCDGTDGATSFPDSSNSGHTVTAFGNARVSEAQFKFGGASAYFDGAGDFLQVPYHTDFDFGDEDFTVEAWVYPETDDSNDVYISRYVASGGRSWSLQFALSGLVLNYSFNGTSHSSVSLNAKPTVGAWNHVAGVRNGDTFRVYLNGVGSDPVVASGALASVPSVNLRIGARSDGQSPYQGWIDEVRITKGIARYTSDFTPPSEPFPDSAGDPDVDVVLAGVAAAARAGLVAAQSVYGSAVTGVAGGAKVGTLIGGMVRTVAPAGVAASGALGAPVLSLNWRQQLDRGVIGVGRAGTIDRVQIEPYRIRGVRGVGAIGLLGLGDGWVDLPGTPPELWTEI